MSTITDHGGDVLRLAGDALIVAFTREPQGYGTVNLLIKVTGKWILLKTCGAPAATWLPLE